MAEISRLEPEAVTDADAADVQRAYAEGLVADGIDAPAPDPAEMAARLRLRRSDEVRTNWVARSGGRIVGRVLLALPTEDNPHVADVGMAVAPAHRRSGLGTALLAEAVREADAAGRRTMLADAYDRAPGAQFCRALGFEAMLSARVSRLPLAALDRAELDRLARAAHPGYRLESWVDRCPDRLVESFAAAQAAMNDAPQGDLDVVDVVITPELVRENERVNRSLRIQQRVVAAVHEASGTVAGFTEVEIPPDPRISHQGDTGVLAAHRGHGLGLWIKSAMLVRLLAERPDLAELRTGNATGNRHMLAINDRLGFEPWLDLLTFQADVPTLAKRLA